jgi:imidazolonepropionase-like amidohydrolase
MSGILLENARVFDGVDIVGEGLSVLVSGDRITEVSDRPIVAPGARRIDVRGR